MSNFKDNEESPFEFNPQWLACYREQADVATTAASVAIVALPCRRSALVYTTVPRL